MSKQINKPNSFLRSACEKISNQKGFEYMQNNKRVCYLSVNSAIDF